MRALRPALVAALVAVSAQPCGPFLTRTMLVPSSSPDGAPSDWVAGRMGLVVPSYASPYLALAFRWWSGPVMDAEDQAGALSFWEEPGAESGESYDILRDKVLPTPPPELLTSDARNYQLRDKVSGEAMAYAGLVLGKRIKAFGLSHPGIKAWVVAQDLAFRGQLPAEPEAGLPEPLKKDRAYQRAASLYYAAQLPEARQAFLAIGRDEASPHQGLARYLALRMAEPGEAFDREMASLQQDPRWRLEAYRLQERLSPPWADLSGCQRLSAQRIMSPGRGFRLGEDLRNLTFTYRAGVDVLQKAEGLQDLGLLGWIQALRAEGPERAIAGFDACQGRAATPWLAAVLMRIDARHPRCGEFLEKARLLKVPSSAYPTFAVHRVRLLLGQGRLQAAEALVEEALARPGLERLVSTRNVLLGQRMTLCRDFGAFVGLLGRTVTATEDEGMEGASSPVDPRAGLAGIDAFDPAAVDAFNFGLPLALWQSALNHPAMARELRPALAQALFVRSVLLGQEGAALALTDELVRVEPKDAQGLQACRGEQDVRRRRFLISQFLWERQWVPFLKQSTRDDYEYRTTWWGTPPRLGANGLVGRPFEPGFLSPEQRRQALQETQVLAHQAPLSYFCREALAFAEAFPKDPQAAEGLSRAVRASRAAYRDEASHALLLKAFRTLHRVYPDSEAARRAKVYH